MGVSNTLYDLRNKLKPWPVTALVPPTIKTPQICPPHPHPDSAEQPTLTASSHEYRPNPPIPSTSTAPRPSTNYSAYNLQGMFKAYTTAGYKYCGLPTENFARKLSLLSEHCEQNGVYDAHLAKAFSIMFKGHALQYYLDSIKSRLLSSDETCRFVRQSFEPEEQTRALIREWDNLSLPLVMNQNAGESQTNCLNFIISHLTDIQSALLDEHHPKNILKNKILNSINDVPQCKLAYQKPANTIHGVIPDLHSALATSTTTSSADQSPQRDNSHLLYAERQLHRSPYQPSQNFRNSSTQAGRRNNGGRHPSKRCIVCFKYMAAGPLTTLLRNFARQGNKKIRQFVTESDDDKELTTENPDQGLDEFISYIQNNSNESSQDFSTDPTFPPSKTSGISDILFLRLATPDDDHLDAAYIATTCNNALVYTP